jgi:hypothetical protein
VTGSIVQLLGFGPDDLQGGKPDDESADSPEDREPRVRVEEKYQPGDQEPIDGKFAGGLH